MLIAIRRFRQFSGFRFQLVDVPEPTIKYYQLVDKLGNAKNLKGTATSTSF